MKLDLGCGDQKYEGFVGVDIRPLPAVDVVADVRYLPFADASVDDAIAQDVLEHLPPSDTLPTLREWFRVLKPGATLTLRVPDVMKIVRRGCFTGGISESMMIHLLYGDQSEAAGGDFGAHRTGFTKTLLHTALTEVGFEVLSIESPEDQHNLVAVARRPG